MQINEVYDRLFIKKNKNFFRNEEAIVFVFEITGYYFILSGENLVLKYLRNNKFDYQIIIKEEKEEIPQYEWLGSYLKKIPNAKSDEDTGGKNTG